jgi:hypothetical protein
MRAKSLLVAIALASSAWAAQAAQAKDDSSADAGAVVLVVLLIVASLLLYFLPSIVGRHKQNFAAILVLNLLLGWTLVGWVVAMVWAVARETPPAQVIVNQSAALPSLFCSSCGKYSPAASKFCATCGTRLA